jgi:hypothetical protein
LDDRKSQTTIGFSGYNKGTHKKDDIVSNKGDLEQINEYGDPIGNPEEVASVKITAETLGSLPND